MSGENSGYSEYGQMHRRRSPSAADAEIMMAADSEELDFSGTQKTHNNKNSDTPKTPDLPDYYYGIESPMDGPNG